MYGSGGCSVSVRKDLIGGEDWELEIVYLVMGRCLYNLCFFFNDTATTEIYTLSLHDALPISKIC